MSDWERKMSRASKQSAWNSQKNQPKKNFPAMGCLMAIAVHVLIVGILFWTGGRHQETQKEEVSQKVAAAQHARTERQQQLQERLTALAKRHNAIIAWEPSGNNPYTADLQDAMIRADGRPIVFTAYLQDIVKTADTYHLFFSPRLLDYFDKLSMAAWQTTLHYWLTCTEEQGKLLLHSTQQTRYESDLTIAAVITSVERPWFTVTPTKASEADIASRIGLRTSNKMIMAYGHLVGFLGPDRDAADILHQDADRTVRELQEIRPALRR